jgi:hypothetical protein
MVLQRDQTNPVWGWAEPGNEVIVTVAYHRVSGKAESDGRWQVTIPGLSVQREPVVIRLRTSSGLENIVVNVPVGDV